MSDAMPTIASWLATRDAAALDRTALIQGNTHVTYRALRDRAAALAAYLASIGLQAGDRIAIWMCNDIEWVVAELAASWLGVAVVAVNSRYKVDETSYMLEHAEVRVLVMMARSGGTDFGRMIAEIAGEVSPAGAGLLTSARLPHLRCILLCGPAAPAFALPAVPFAAATAPAASLPPPQAVAEGILNIIYTSGTTSRPKGVQLSERALLPHARAVARWSRVGPEDRVLLLTPFCGIYGLDSLLMVLTVGASGIIVPEFDAEQTLDMIGAGAVTAVAGTVDATVKRWAELQRRQPRNLSAIRGTVIPVGWMQGTPEAEMPAVEQALGVTFVHVYGLSETNAMVIVGMSDDGPARRHPLCGRPLSPDIMVRITDPETGAELPAGQPGEIRLRGPILFSGYLKNPDATAAAFDAQGWFHTGDLGILDADGYTFYRGRLKDIVKISGFTVSPAEVEDYLRQYEAIAAVAVVGFRADGQDALGAAVVARPGARLVPDDVAGFCAGRIASYKIPRRVVVLDALPTKQSANSDKTDLDALRRLLAQ